MILIAIPATDDDLDEISLDPPSPRQIKQRTAQIRHSWSSRERARRAQRHLVRIERLAARLLPAGAVAPEG